MASSKTVVGEGRTNSKRRRGEEVWELPATHSRRGSGREGMKCFMAQKTDVSSQD